MYYYSYCFVPCRELYFWVVAQHNSTKVLYWLQEPPLNDMTPVKRAALVFTLWQISKSGASLNCCLCSVLLSPKHTPIVICSLIRQMNGYDGYRQTDTMGPNTTKECESQLRRWNFLITTRNVPFRGLDCTIWVCTTSSLCRLRRSIWKICVFVRFVERLLRFAGTS